MKTKFFAKSAIWKNSRNISSLHAGILGNMRSLHSYKTLSTSAIIDCKLLPQEDIIKHQQLWFDRLTESTKIHCAYLASIGLADRVKYFKVNPFIYKDSEAIEDISRFNHPQA